MVAVVKSEYVVLSNVIFELYKAALAGEITQDEFVRAKRIVKRARVIEDDEVKAWLKEEETDAF